MAHHLCLLLMCLLAGCLADDIISALTYSLDNLLQNGVIYTHQEVPASIFVTVDSFSAGNPLSLSFGNAAMTHFTNIKVVSACKTVDGVEVFAMSSGKLVAMAPITERITCSYAAVVLPTEANQVMENLYNERLGPFSVAPFTVLGGSLGGYWHHDIVRFGATAVLTIEGDIPFKASQGFIITASNGSPFTSAEACIGEDGSAVFNVAARGTRLLLVARTALSKPFTCDINVVIGQTHASAANYTASVPELSITSTRFSPVLGLLDREDYHVHIGRVGVSVGVSNWVGESPAGPMSGAATTSIYADRSGDHVLSLGIPVAAIDADDTITLHHRVITHVGLGQCFYTDGTPVGLQRDVVRISQYDLIDAQTSTLITLSTLPQPSAGGRVYVHCPVQVLGPAPALVIAAVSVPSGVFAVRQPDTQMTALRGYDIFSSNVNAMITSYGTNFTVFSGEMFFRNPDPYDHIEVDFSLRGVGFTDITEVNDKCVLLRRTHDATGAAESRVPNDIPATNMGDIPAGVVVLEDGEIRVRLDAARLAALGTYLSITCRVPVEEGQVITIYDNKLGKAVISDTARASSLDIAFGDGAQTHWMGSEAVYDGITIPFSVSLADLYVPEAVKQGYDGVIVRIRSYDVNIGTTNPIVADVEEQPIELQCSTGRATATRRSGTTAVGEVTHTYSELTITVDGFTAECRGAVVLDVHDNPTGASLNAVELLMTRSTSGQRGHLATFSSTAYAAVVTRPKLLTTQELSFRSDTITLGAEAAFTVSHTLLPREASITLTFDADVSAVAPTCAYADAADAEAVPVDVLQCTLAQDKRSVTCVKQDVAITHACTLRLTFAPDFLRRVQVTSTFTGLPAGTVFAPTFAIPVQPAGGTVTVAPAIAGRAVIFSLSLPRPLRRTDSLSFTHVNGDVGELFFDSYQPTLYPYGFSSTTVGDTVHISLDNLLVNALTKDNFQVQFAHVLQPPAFPSDSLTIQFQVNGVKLPAVTPTFTRDLVYTIGYVPSAARTRYNIVQIHHGGLKSGDILGLPSTQFEQEFFPTLYCGNSRFGGYSGSFYISDVPIPPEVPCYAVFPTFRVLKPYWVVRMRKDGGIRDMYAKVTRNTAVGMEVRESSGVFVAGVATNITVVFYDITTAFLTEEGYISFTYDSTVMDITAAYCPGFPVSVLSTTVRITLEAASIPLADLRTLECTIRFTPRTAAIAPALTQVNILGKDFPDASLKPFQAEYYPSFTIVPSSATTLWRDGVVEFSVTISQLALEAGDHVFFRSSDVADSLIEWTACVGHSVQEGEIVIQEPISLITATTTTFTCSGAVRYTSSVPVPYVAVVRTAVGGAQTFTTSVPLLPAYTPGLSVSELSLTHGAVTYRAVRHALPGTYFTTFTVGNYSQHSHVELHSNCPVHNRTQDSVTIAFTATTAAASSACDLTLTFTAAYHPAVLPYALSLLYTQPTQSLVGAEDTEDEEVVVINISAVQVAAPSLIAHATADEVRFLFTNSTTATITVDNVWSISATATAPLPILSLADNATVGYFRTSSDGMSLLGNFNEGIVVTSDGRHTLTTPCYFRTTGLHGMPLQSQATMLGLSLGPLQQHIFLKSIGYAFHARAESAMMLPDSTFTLQLWLSLTGNRGSVAVDYTNTGLASVKSCFRATNSTHTAFTEPLPITSNADAATDIAGYRVNNSDSSSGRSGVIHAVAGSNSFSFDLTEDTVSGDSGPYINCRCTFTTLTAEQARARTQARALSDILSVTITVAPDDVESEGVDGAPVAAGTAAVLFSTQVRVPLPYHAPNTLGLTQAVNFTRSTSFDAATLAALARIYARALRTVVPALVDDQVAVTRQQLYLPGDVEGDMYVTSRSEPVPAPIATMFPVASTTPHAIVATSATDITGGATGFSTGTNSAGSAVVLMVFRVSSTTAVPVTAEHVAAAAPAIVTAFTEADHTATLALVTDVDVVEGDCTVRCGVRCALCTPGEVCAYDSECVTESCTSDHVCAAEPLPPRPPEPPGPLVPDNAAPAMESLVVALLVACAMVVL